MNQINQNTIILIVSVGVTAFMVLRWVRGRMLRNRARDWPKVVGKVEASALQMESRGNNQSVHVATIDYSYEALGTACRGVWRRSTLLHGKGKGWIDKYPAGVALSVRYDPDKPGSSVILDADQA